MLLCIIFSLCLGNYLYHKAGEEVAFSIWFMDVRTEEEVLMITYGDIRFPFIGDIEEAAQTRIYDKYEKKFSEAAHNRYDVRSTCCELFLLLESSYFL